VKYDRPGFRSKFLAMVLRVIPKVGPFRSLSFKLPTPEAEQLFIKSFTASVDRYRTLLAEASRTRLVLQNRNFDTGQLVKAGDYRRVDESYGKLLDNLQARDFQEVSPALRKNIVDFFTAMPKPSASKDLKEWQKRQGRLAQLKLLAAN